MKIDYLSIKSSLTMAGFQVSYFFYLFEKAPIVSPSFEEEAYFFSRKPKICMFWIWNMWHYLQIQLLLKFKGKNFNLTLFTRKILTSGYHLQIFH